MQDYIGEFRKKKNRKNTIIVLSGLAFAVMLNLVLFVTPSGTGKNLQTSVINYVNPKTDAVVNPDLFLARQGSGSDMLDMKVGKDMGKVSEIRLSIVTNPEGISLKNIFSENKDIEVVKSSEVAGNHSIYLRFKSPADIKTGETLLKIVYSKTAKDNVSLNLVETYFLSEGKRFDLSNSGIDL